MTIRPIEFDEEAKQDFLRLEKRFQLAFLQHLKLLQENPEEKSRPTSIPHPPGFLVSEFTYHPPGEFYLLSVIFEYGDGGVLLMRWFGRVKYDSDPDEFEPPF